MSNLPFRKSIRAAGRCRLPLVYAALVVMAASACTDLGETPVSSNTPENFYQNEVEVAAGLVPIYAQLRNTLGHDGYWGLQEVSTDEMIVPTRGGDWDDNGKWRELHRHQWLANSPAGLDFINRAWADVFTGIARANGLLALLPANIPNKAGVEAEIRTLRAYYYYLLMDMFGGVPIITTSAIELKARNTRAEVFAFIETELNAARAVLPAEWDATLHGRVTKGVADAILANMYLNAEVYTGTVTAAGLTKGPAKWQQAIDAADRILNSGEYILATDWRSNFTHTNHTSTENIFVVKFLNQTDLGFNFLQRTLHYNQLSPSPWNGFATLAETYNAFDQDDQRREIFLVGPQINFDNGQPALNRLFTAPLVFTVDIVDPLFAGEGEGARFYKWPADPGHAQANHGNDFAIFRLAEILLIKAEALFELGQAGEALTILNTLRARVFDPDENLTAIDRDVILRERLFELTAEGKRRQDLIRHGKFNLAYGPMKLQASQPYRILMPIPQQQMDANPNLVQNAGY